ncbi:DsbE family thiol:disulfide interchange protein [Thiorhodococcus mannitoliphagus]|uniref:DsbE family thiol:disulfide interchange protein n=1 Tax=Thiorhodococcus mannitoliphagus TaxID=329406 RepID=A0A6P1E3Q8_9GAMM|nr:DsbE family thiol:disulfide interchange protein [Thiorhodococcus mannitoliphagus]NEX23142.1 DsbE family thiol:disulfide interchange protein [Thiorhodococcus mannitoliphagus]
MNTSASRALIPLGIFLALAALLFYGLQLDPRKIPSPLVDKPAPDFRLESLKDPSRTMTKDVLLGQVSLVNVWASWCPSCRQEHGELMRIARRNKDIQFVGFNWKDSRPEALQMLKQFGDPYALSIYDPDNRSGIDWGVYGAPETFIVDAEGIIRHKHVGPIDAQVWEQEIRPIVEQYQAKKS